jgi:Ca2+-binding EF-hand superfamily protein
MKKLLLITGALLMATTHSTFAAQQNQNAATQRAHKQQMTFAQLDANADGVLSKDEVRGRLLANFDKHDSEGNGTLSADEFNADVKMGKHDKQGNRGHKEDPEHHPTFAQLDINNDDLLAKDEVRGRLLTHFDKVDSDASGTLSSDEFNAHVKMGKHDKQGNRGHKGDPEHHPTFAQLDINNNDLLAKDEVRGRLLTDFDKVDSDASGTLSTDEFNARVKMGKQGNQRHHQGKHDYRPSFEQLDLNGDGVLSAGEFNAVVNNS